MTTRLDQRVDFDWNTGTPAGGVGPDHFTVRWHGGIEAPAPGPFTFIVDANNGARLWVNGELVADCWRTANPDRSFRGTINLPQGVHPIRLDYHEETDVAAVTLMWIRPGDSTPTVVPSRYLYDVGDLPADLVSPGKVTGLSASLVDGGMILSWSSTGDDDNAGSPARYAVRAAPAQLNEGTWWRYKDVAVEWLPALGVTQRAFIPAFDGGPALNFSVKAYDETPNPGEASSPLMVQMPGFAGHGAQGRYFSDLYFANLAFTRVDPLIDWTWNTSSAGNSPGPTDTNFSVEWTTRLIPRVSGTTTLGFVHDDGVRLYIDGNRVINDFTGGSARESTTQFQATAGTPVSLRIEYYQGILSGAAQLTWIPPGGTREVVPPSVLFLP